VLMLSCSFPSVAKSESPPSTTVWASRTSHGLS
jgi:hypothetical protein